jgi:DNA-binding GntR family transcriptional regulator
MCEFKSVSLADQVFEKLESDIITGFYPRGEVLTELKLVEQLGVSRTPIREALRRLEHERLIADSGKGSVVLGITIEDLMDIMEIRQRVEGLAAYYATKNMTAEELEQMRSISDLQDFYFTKRDLDRLRQMDDQFHSMIYQASGRTVLRDALKPLHRKTQRYRKQSISDDTRLEASIREHKEIFKAIEAKNANLAEELMTKHISNAKEYMVGRYQYNG